MVPDAEERLVAACNDLGLCISENMASCMHAFSLLDEMEEADVETEAQTHTPAVAETPKAEGDHWLAVELAAAKRVFIETHKHAPQLPLPLEVFRAHGQEADAALIPADEEEEI